MDTRRGVGPAHPHSARGVVENVRALERRAGIYRPGRSPWVWIIGPGANFVGTVVVVLICSLRDLGWLVAAPLALFCGGCMGTMAWAFMGTSFSEEEDELRAATELDRERLDQARD